MDGRDEPDIFQQQPKRAWQPPDPTPPDYGDELLDAARHTILDPKDLDRFMDGMKALRRHVPDDDAWVELLAGLTDLLREQQARRWQQQQTP